jgi:hypothetical protein
MTHLQGECSHRRAEEEEDEIQEFNFGGVLVLSNPPASPGRGPCESATATSAGSGTAVEGTWCSGAS